MHLRFLRLPLIAMGALAACQSSGPVPDSTPNDFGDGSESGRTVVSDPPGAFVAPVDSTRHKPAESTFGASNDRDSMPPAQDLHGAPSTNPWGAGTMHIALGGNFVNEDTDDGVVDPGDDVESLDVNATLGVFVSNHIELNVQGTYHELDVGADDINQIGLLGGVRYHLILPTDESPLGVYAEGKAGVLSVDRASGDSTDFAYGASGGVLWFPWGVTSGVAIDVALNYLKADEIDRTTASLALAYYW